jgi:oleandomycin transport system permease protein
VAAIGLMLLFGFALSWIGIAAGALVRTPEALQGVIFAVVFPLTFVSTAFVDPKIAMPEWLAWFAYRQPMSLVIDAVRDLTIFGEAGPAFVPALLWSVIPLAIFVPLGIWLYNRRTTQ